MYKRYLEAGKAVTTHGIAGEIKVYPWCDGAEVLCSLKKLYLDPEGRTALKISSARVHKGMALIKLEGVGDIDAARRYVERVFYLDRDELTLPEGRFFIEDLIGGDVVDADTGERYGEIADVTMPAGRTVYHVKLSGGETRMIPAAADYVTGVEADKDGARLFIRPIGGLLSDED